MQPIIKQTHKLLIKNKKTLAVAESCTGGLVSYFLTSLSGSSEYFILGLVAYSNKAKSSILGIPASIILHKGAVSKEVAQSLSRQVRKFAKTDFGIGITGIAGPNGGSNYKPVGTVFISVDSKNRRLCREFHFQGTRQEVQKSAALKALQLLKTLIKRGG
ncbi:MAG: CinA family protein [Candidatus Omnitrophica bacterium]|nr:CinA family protein [Candidatus Omnitrophota bacterium]